MKKFFTPLVFILISTWNLFSQTCQFLQEHFDEINISYDHIYGENATVLYFPFYEEAVKQSLLLDLYEPAESDTLRPLIIYFHSGNFLPFPNNLGVTGTRKDSSVVTMCKRLAKVGYVVASADYRLGWNPVATSIDERKLGLINAAYRGVQDANTCIRYFKKSVVEDGNPFGIDTSRIVLWGDDSGGYIALHAGCLDDYDKIPFASDGKFLLGGLLPMVLEYLNGDVEAKQFGINIPKAAHLPFPEGDTLCYVNHPEYSSKFSVTVNLSGAVGDTAWIDPGQPPIISIHTPYDLTTPYKEGIVYVFIPPGTYLEVVEVQGSYLISRLANELGNNDTLAPPKNINSLQYSVTDIANSRNDGLEGLFPVRGDVITDATPWVFFNCDSIPETNCQNGLATNPNMSKAKATLYMDSILAYVLPRLYTSLDLSEVAECTVGINEVIKSDNINIIAFPNPSFHEVFIATSKDFLIRSIRVYDIKGSLVDSHSDINFNYFHLPVDNLIPGQYVLKFQFDQGISARQIIVK